MRNQFEEALHFRHACKVFDKHRKIPEDDLRFILESIRMSPSSFGMEAWKFLVIQDGELKKRLATSNWNPTKVEDCSDVVVLLSMKNMRSTNPHVTTQFKCRGDQYAQYVNIYGDFIDPRSDEEINCWAGKQVYLASGFLMMGAASIGVDSCPIEGFRKDEAIEILEIDTEKYNLEYMIALGYRVNEQQPRYRRDINDIVEFR